MFGRPLGTENRNYPSLHHPTSHPTPPHPSISTGQKYITKLLGSCLQIHPQIPLTVVFYQLWTSIAIHQLRWLPVAISPNHPGTRLSYVRTGCWPSIRKQPCILAVAKPRTQTYRTSKHKADPRLTKQRSQQEQQWVLSSPLLFETITICSY